MREMRRLGATEEEALEGRRAPGVDALEDAKPTEVSELELQAVQSLVTGGVRDAEPPFTLSDFFTALPPACFVCFVCLAA